MNENSDTEAQKTSSLTDTPPPATPVSSPQLTENRGLSELPQPEVKAESESTPKKTAAKKPASKRAAKKSTAKRAASKKASAPSREDATAKRQAKLVEVAEEILGGSRKWGTGREQEHTLVAAGFDPATVRAEVQRLRVAKMTNNL